MTRRVVTVVFVGLLLCCLTVVAADKPDFSGTWKLNVEKSDFGPMPKPEKADYTIVHKDPEMNVKSVAVGSMGEITNEVKILTDGTEFTNTVRGQEVKGTAKWDGKTLVVTQKLEIQGTAITFIQKWTLSDDGKSIVQEVNISTPQGEVAQKAVLDKV
ncbi:MAG: hypothetical protein ABSE21_15290 [Bryobacteraceae bacterium]|jgi:hypothetical protein